MALITLTGVSKSFRGTTVLNNVNVAFDEGRIYGIQGHNGSGKSVLFKMMCKFVDPDSGTVHIDEKYLSSSKDFPESFGVIIDRPGYLPTSTGVENLRSLARIRRKISDEAVVAAMLRVGLDPRLPQKVKNYSLGMKQKLALAQAFMEEQQVLILDEPFNGLDATSIERVRSLLLEFRDEGRTIIFTSHNSEDMKLLADRCWRINNQTLEEAG
ncbi:ABC transporter ATP-binding protein [Micropruina sp.]|uniref:ABC transporter ATP-binding protein n=1 Tax=Micropruina sp. TaxID=2737536 RepID=UPI0039E5AB8E